jgi:hypothetical protein
MHNLTKKEGTNKIEKLFIIQENILWVSVTIWWIFPINLIFLNLLIFHTAALDSPYPFLMTFLLLVILIFRLTGFWLISLTHYSPTDTETAPDPDNIFGTDEALNL